MAHNSSALHMRSIYSKVDLTDATYVFSDKPAGSAFYQCSTYDTDMRVQRCMIELVEDAALLPRLYLGI